MVGIKVGATSIVKKLKISENFSKADMDSMLEAIEILCKTDAEMKKENIEHINFIKQHLGIDGLSIKKNLKTNEFIVYIHDRNERCIIGKYKTSDTKEVAYIILIELINYMSWNKVCDIAPSQGMEYIVYGDEEEQFEHNFKQELIDQMPDYCKEYFNIGYDIRKKAKYFTDSDEYKEWLEK